MIIRGDRDSLEAKAAWILAESIQYLLDTQRHVVLAVQGEGDVGGVFRCLVRENVDWERVHIFMVDERMVPLAHPDCNFNLVQENLREIISLATLHPFSFAPEQYGGGIEAYRSELERLGGSFDIVLVSSGEDGHIAALFPGLHPSAEDSCDFLLVHDALTPPSVRMTASPRLLLRCQVGLILFFGRGKRAALEGFLDGARTVGDCPTKIIGLLPQHYVLTDLEVRE